MKRLVYASNNSDFSAILSSMAHNQIKEIQKFFLNLLSELPYEFSVVCKVDRTSIVEVRIDAAIYNKGVDSLLEYPEKENISFWYRVDDESLEGYYSEIGHISYPTEFVKFDHRIYSIDEIPYDWDKVVDLMRDKAYKNEDLYNKAKEIDDIGPDKVLQSILTDNNIPYGPISKYEITLYNGANRTFQAKSDWLACFGILLRKSPTPKALLNHFGIEYFKEDMSELAYKYPSVNKLINPESGPVQDWADPGDKIPVIMLVNTTTNKVIYKDDFYIHKLGD